MQSIAEEKEDFCHSMKEGAQHVKALAQDDRKQLEARALEYAAMKNSWDLLKFLMKRIAKPLLAVMDPKKAAKILDKAVKDPERKERPDEVSIHNEMMNVYIDGLTSNHVERMANLYGLMKPAQVIPYLNASAPSENSRILDSMAVTNTNVVSIMTQLATANPAKAAS